ncbi:hypothetical protein, partial [Pseudomonas putida]
APEGNREHSIGHQVSALNVGFMEHLPLNPFTVLGLVQDLMREGEWGSSEIFSFSSQRDSDL